MVRNRDGRSRNPANQLDPGCQRREALGRSPVSGLSNLKNSMVLLIQQDRDSWWAALQRAERHGSHSCLYKYTCSDSPPHPGKLKLIQPGLFWLFWHLQVLKSTLPHGPSSSSQAHQELLRASRHPLGCLAPKKIIKRTHTPTTLLKYDFSEDHKIPASSGLGLTHSSPSYFLPVCYQYVTSNITFLFSLHIHLHITSRITKKIFEWIGSKHKYGPLKMHAIQNLGKEGEGYKMSTRCSLATTWLGSPSSP